VFRTWLPLNVVVSSTTTEVTARAHISRARLGLVLQSCRRVPLGCMQGGSRCPGPAVEPVRARWHDPVLGRWLGLTPEQPALCLRRFPRRPRVALSRVSDPPGLGTVGVREPWGRLGGRYAKNVTICPTQACTKPTTCEVSTATSTTRSTGVGDTRHPTRRRGRGHTTAVPVAGTIRPCCSKLAHRARSPRP
jgi:hypothetical protein